MLLLDDSIKSWLANKHILVRSCCRKRCCSRFRCYHFPSPLLFLGWVVSDPPSLVSNALEPLLSISLTVVDHQFAASCTPTFANPPIQIIRLPQMPVQTQVLPCISQETLLCVKKLPCKSTQIFQDFLFRLWCLNHRFFYPIRLVLFPKLEQIA